MDGANLIGALQDCRHANYEAVGMNSFGQHDMQKTI
jgi:hypothetical protein